MSHRRTVAAAALGTLALAGCAGLQPPRAAAPEPATVAALERLSGGPCDHAVAAVLAGQGIRPSALRSVTYSGDGEGPFAPVQGYDVWLHPQGRDGALVVTVDALCRPVQVYARGGASPDGAWTR